MSLASYEAPGLPAFFWESFFAVLFELFEDSFAEPARAFFSAKNTLPFVRENPERRWLQISRETSVGASDQVDIKDTSLDPWNNHAAVTFSLQITHKSSLCLGFGAAGLSNRAREVLAG
jgi:hypothetical protein